MGYRFVKVTTFYPTYLEQHGRRFPASAQGSYAKQQALLFQDHYGWADYFAFHLRQRGVDAHEVVANWRPLRRAWCRENGVAPSTAEDERVWLMAYLRRVRPDVVFFQNAFRFNGDWLRELRRQVPSIRVALGWCAAQFKQADLQGFAAFDAMLTWSPRLREVFEAQGMRVFRMDHAFDARVLDALNARGGEREASDFAFLGSLVLAPGFHNARLQLLERLLGNERIHIQIYSDLVAEPPAKMLAKQGVYLMSMAMKRAGLERVAERLPYLKYAIHWPRLPRPPEVSPRAMSATRPPVYGLDMFEVVSQARICFNSHLDGTGEDAGNMRMFEVTGVGSCLLTDWKRNLHTLFEDGKEVVSYRSDEECLEKVNWLLAHPTQRDEIARAGQQRCLRDHTFAHRAQQLDQWIRMLRDT